MIDNNIIILCDYSGTVELENSKPLRDALQELKDEGAMIILATDALPDDASDYLENLKQSGYNFCSTSITFNTFFCQKDMDRYYKGLGQLYNLSKVILLDDNERNIAKAAAYGVTTVSSVNKNAAAAMIKHTYHHMAPAA